jgi:hypothetical protein
MSTTLRDQLLRSETRLAMLEDRLDVLYQRLRDGVRTFVLLVQLAGVYVVLRWIDKRLRRRGL